MGCYAYENSLSEISAKKHFLGLHLVRISKCGHDKCVEGDSVVCTRHSHIPKAPRFTSTSRP